MKKFFPLLVTIIAFSGFLAGQIFFEMLNTQAGSLGKSKEKYGLYENNLKMIRLKTIDGKKLELSKAKDKIVILNFWASWCTPCLKEFPSLVNLRNKYGKDKLEIIGINSDDDEQMKSIKKIKKEYNLNFDIVADKNSEISSKFHITEIPYSIIFKNGRVIDTAHGETDFTSSNITGLIETSSKKN
jgi:thiol-disulfide isomerase/thioredoxin